MPPNRWVGSTSGGICPSLRSGYPWAALYSLSEPTAWPPALRAESEIPPPAFGRPPPFLKGGFILSRGQKGSLEPLRNEWRARLPGPSGCPALRRTAHSFTRGRAEAWNRPRNQWRAKPEPPSLAQRRRERQSYQGASGGPDSAANSGRDGPTPPPGRLSPCTGVRGAPRPLFVTFSRQRK